MIELVRYLRAINVLAKFENDPWKIMDVRVLTGLVCPAARPPARPLGVRQYPGALKGCGVKTSHATHPQMIVIICAKYKKNPSRPVDTTERTRFSKSRPNDLEDIGQGQGSSQETHPFMLLIICTKYGKNPSWIVDATGRTRKVNGQTDGQTDGRTEARQTDGQGESNIPP